MKATETDLGTNDPDNVLLYPAPNYMQSAPTVREHVGEVRSPTARSCRAEEVVIPINRQTSSATSGYVSKQGTAFSRGFGPEHQPSTENYTPSVCRATSPKSFSLSNGAGESCFSSTAFNRISSPNSSTFCANETNTTHLLPVQSPFYRDSQVAPPPVLTRETSRRFDTGTDDISRTEWSRREESVRETGSIRRFPVRPTATSPNNTTPLLNGHLQHLPPLSPPTTKTNSNSVRIIRSPTRVQKTGGDIITTEEVLKEDDNTETIIRRRTIRRKRIPQSPLAIREDTVSEDGSANSFDRFREESESQRGFNARRRPSQTRHPSAHFASLQRRQRHRETVCQELGSLPLVDGALNSAGMLQPLFTNAAFSSVVLHRSVVFACVIY
uniref:SH2 domain-containing protein n=1 Tax=Mesocestoides corti TaxID=53468 RepID=A0A5K3F9C8_MESCO